MCASFFDGFPVVEIRIMLGSLCVEMYNVGLEGMKLGHVTNTFLLLFFVNMT